MALRIKAFSSAQIARQKAGRKVSELFLSSQDKSTLFLISGGSSLDVLPEIEPQALSSNITLGVLDDRMSTDSQINNFLQFTKTPLYPAAKKLGVLFLSSVPAYGDTVEAWGEKYNQVLENWFNSHPNAITIALMGIGADGHTAGIMRCPDNPEMFKKLFIDTDKKAVGYDATGRNPYPLRMTLTIPFIKIIDHAVVYTVGETKKEALVKSLAPSGTLWETPGRIILEMPDVWLFTDQKL